MTATIAWNDGDGVITLDFTGEGDGTIAVSSLSCNGLDREQVVTVTAADKEIALTVKQPGLYELLAAFDDDFSAADGDFAVLKQ